MVSVKTGNRRAGSQTWLLAHSRSGTNPKNAINPNRTDSKKKIRFDV